MSKSTQQLLEQIELECADHTDRSGICDSCMMKAYVAGQASQRARDAPYMQHKPGCVLGDIESGRLQVSGQLEGYEFVPTCTCGLDTIRSSSLTEQA